MTHFLHKLGAPRKRIAILAVLSGFLVPGAALACNPIEALFGACRLDVFRPAYNTPDYAPRYRPALRERRAEPRHASRGRGLDADGVGPKQTPIAPTAETPNGSLALFRQDKTLRNGDVVATNDGFRVFRNGEFVPIAHDGGRLARLEKASMIGRPAPEAPPRRVADRRP